MRLEIRRVETGTTYQVYPQFGVPSGFLVENKDYEIEASTISGALHRELLVTINDIPLDKLTRRARTIFPFSMDFYAGDLRIAVIADGKVLLSVDAEVDPDISKLTRSEYAAMISDIARSTLALYRLSHVTVPAAADAVGVRSDLVTLELVRANIDAFERAVSRIANQPVRALRSVRVDTDIRRARQIDDIAVANALRSGRYRRATFAESRLAPSLVGALGGRWISSLPVKHREDRLDLYENRALLGFIRWLDASLAQITRRLTITELPRSAAVIAWIDRVTRWRARLRALGNRGLFAGLAPDPLLRATTVFRMHPDYASAFSCMCRIRAGLGTGSAAAPSVSIDRTYVLYEIWCYIEMLRAAAEAFPGSRAAVANLLRGCKTPNDLGTVLRQGEGARLQLSSDLSLTYQRRFGRQPSADGCRTHIIDAVPDITLSRTDHAGHCTGLVVIDPKYRTGAALLDGIRDLHVYRDALISVEGMRLVSGAIALSPRPGEIRHRTEDLPEDSPIAWTARPGHDPQTFRRVLTVAADVLSSA